MAGGHAVPEQHPDLCPIANAKTARPQLAHQLLRLWAPRGEVQIGRHPKTEASQQTRSFLGLVRPQPDRPQGLADRCATADLLRGLRGLGGLRGGSGAWVASLCLFLSF